MGQQNSNLHRSTAVRSVFCRNVTLQIRILLPEEPGEG